MMQKGIDAMHRVELIRHECEVVRHNPNVYFLISGYDKPIGIKYVVEELMQERNMKVPQEMKAGTYNMDLLNHMIVAASRLKNLPPSATPAFDRVFRNLTLTTPQAHDRITRFDYGTADYIRRSSDFTSMDIDIKPSIDHFFDQTGEVLFVVDLTNYFDAKHLRRVVQMLQHENVNIIFHCVSQYSELYQFIKNGLR
jgi:hypothetical protein